MELNHDFCRTLALLRKEKKVSQREAAKALGISQALLSHYENGAREPGLAFVRKACDYYRVSADFLLGRSMSREGTTIGAEELYDASAQKGNVVRGNISAMLNKKLIVNSVDVLFGLLGRVGSREAIQAAANYLSSAVYQLVRDLYRASGPKDEELFSISGTHFSAGCVNADMAYSQADYMDALEGTAREKGKEVFPQISNDALTQDYPGGYQSFLQIVHTTGERVNYNLENRWKGKK